jgi:uncharacterized protein (TIGR00730 family)
MNVCVFCGSATGHHLVYSEAARELGSLLGSNKHTLVYGGGNIGLMGIVADSTMKAGGKVIGVIPDFLAKREVAHHQLTELIVVDSMHERKKKMADISDTFIAMAGGWGTLDELAEILTWRQLGLIKQPIGILNTKQFFTPLLQSMTTMVKEGFLSQDNFELLQVSESPKNLLTALGVETR